VTEILEEFTGECLCQRSTAAPVQAIVADLLKTGLYQSQIEVVREGLRLLKEREAEEPSFG
jgi:hypothetical protein